MVLESFCWRDFDILDVDPQNSLDVDLKKGKPRGRDP